MSIVLASASRIRRTLLENAGLEVTVDAAAIDEAAIKESLTAQKAPPAAIADTLAELKGQRVLHRHPGRIVIGAHQMLECESRLFDKPADIAGARRQLQSLRGPHPRLLSPALALPDA